MADLLIVPFPMLDASGDPVSGAKYYFYATGTTTPVTVYSDTSLTTPQASPLVADSAGRVTPSYYGASTAVKLVVTDADDVTLLTWDPIGKVGTSTSGADEVSFMPYSDNPSLTVQDAIEYIQDEIEDTTGEDPDFVTGTAGADGELAVWNSDGDVVGETLTEVVNDGVTATSASDGTKSSGTYTPTPVGGNFKNITNGGAFTLAAPTASGDYTLVIQVTNNASAGAITFSGFSATENTGALTTTDGDDFLINIIKCNGFTYASVVALQ